MISVAEKVEVVYKDLASYYDEDIVQEFLLEQTELGWPGEFKTRKKWYAYARQYLHLMSHNHRRKEDLRTQLRDEHRHEIAQNTSPTVNGMTAEGPEDMLLMREAIQKWLSSLTAQERAVADCTLFNSMEVEQAAQELGLTPKSIYRTRDRIKDKLEEYLYDN